MVIGMDQGDQALEAQRSAGEVDRRDGRFAGQALAPIFRHQAVAQFSLVEVDQVFDTTETDHLAGFLQHQRKAAIAARGIVLEDHVRQHLMRGVDRRKRRIAGIADHVRMRVHGEQGRLVTQLERAQDQALGVDNCFQSASHIMIRSSCSSWPACRCARPSGLKPCFL